MKTLKYIGAIALSFLSIFVPMGIVFVGFMLSLQKGHIDWLGMSIPTGTTALLYGLIIGGVLLTVGILAQKPLQRLRINTRRAVEYDEYGRSKTKGDYERLSKAERDAIDFQKTVDMERLVSTTALKRMTHEGPKDPMKELDSLVGLAPVKQKVREMVARMEFETAENKKRKKGEKSVSSMSGRHLCFTGSAGTGKTTMARIMTGFLYQYGYIKENKCVEIDGNFLKAGTESATKTELVLRRAYGGVLFIDEAYVLNNSSDSSGEQVVATLIKQMEDQRGKFVLILAGYTNEMKELIASNTGFESRIKDFLHFPDYDAVEMREILQNMAAQNNFVVDVGAYDIYDALIERERKSRSFGNGRTARNILDKAIDRHALNLSTNQLGQEDRYRLCSIDFQNIQLGAI